MPHADADDLDVVLRAARDGDEAAFVTLFRALQPRLLAYLRGLAGGEAEDLAAETWATVVRGLPTFDGDARGFRAWLFMVAHSRTVDAWRARARRPETLMTTPPETVSAVDVPGAVEETLSTEDAVDLLRRLPESQAQVLLLRVVAGLDVPTTAQVLGRTPNHVRVLAHRGLKALAEIVAADPDEPGQGPL